MESRTGYSLRPIGHSFIHIALTDMGSGVPQGERSTGIGSGSSIDYDSRL